MEDEDEDERKRLMITLLQRDFTVNVPLQQAWDLLARIEEWPSWARHIKKIDLQPPGRTGAAVHGRHSPDQRHPVGVSHDRIQPAAQ